MQKQPRKLSRPSLENAARAYLGRYASSAENLRRVLARRVDRRCRALGGDPAEWTGVVADIVQRFQTDIAYVAAAWSTTASMPR